MKNLIKLQNPITQEIRFFKAPKSWGDMSLKELKIWLEIVGKKVEITHALGLAVIKLYKLPYKTYMSLAPAQHVQIKDTLKFLVKENRLSSWVIPYVKINIFSKKYWGPSPKLTTSSIEEFRFTEMFYIAYSKTKKEEYLDQLIACLFRTAGRSKQCSDRRQDLTERLIMDEAPNMRYLKKSTREAILFNYDGCRRYIFKAYPTVFKISKAEQSSGKIPDLIGLISVVAGGKFGNFKETESTLLYKFLDHLASEIENAERKSR